MTSHAFRLNRVNKQHTVAIFHNARIMLCQLSNVYWTFTSRHLLYIDLLNYLWSLSFQTYQRPVHHIIIPGTWRESDMTAAARTQTMEVSSLQHRACFKQPLLLDYWIQMNLLQLNKRIDECILHVQGGNRSIRRESSLTAWGAGRGVAWGGLERCLQVRGAGRDVCRLEEQGEMSAG